MLSTLLLSMQKKEIASSLVCPMVDLKYFLIIFKEQKGFFANALKLELLNELLTRLHAIHSTP